MNCIIVLYFILTSQFALGEVKPAPIFTEHQDTYKNYSELILQNNEGVDFRVTEQHRQSPITIIAPHAGRIEIGTSEIAKAIAGSFFNLYLFEGIKQKENFKLHITSDHFDEPRALTLIAGTKLGVSIHGYKDDQKESACVGGGNKVAAEVVAASLTKLGIEVEFPCTKFSGESKDNIVNRALHHGVQIELSSKLRTSLLKNQEKLAEFGNTIRSELERMAMSSQKLVH